MTVRPSTPAVVALEGLVLTAAGVEAFDCPVCGCARDLVVPSCDDDPGPADECPDRACAVCGFALAVGLTRPDSPHESTLQPRRAG